MASSSRFDRLQDQINENANTLSEKASSLADAAEVNVDTYSDTTGSLASAASGVGVSVSSGNAEAAAATKANPTSAYDNESDEVKTIIRHIEHYALEAGSNKRLSRTDLVSLQTLLVRNLEQLVNLKSNADFAVCFKRLMTLVRENRTGAFSLNNLNRAISSLNKGNNFIDNYTKFIDMVVLFSDPTMRTTYVRRYNLAAGAKFAKNEYQERLIEFIRNICGVQ